MAVVYVSITDFHLLVCFQASELNVVCFVGGESYVIK